MASLYCKGCGMCVPDCICRGKAGNKRAVCNLGLFGCNGPVGADPNATCGSCKRQAQQLATVPIRIQRGEAIFAGRIPGIGPAIDVIGCRMCGTLGHTSAQHKCSNCGIVGDHRGKDCQVAGLLARLAPSPIVRPVPGRSMPGPATRPGRFCTGCGQERQSVSDRFCSGCGNQL